MTPEQEVRSAGLCCPSCGGNLADVMKASHRLALTYTGDGPGFGTAECCEGKRVELTTLTETRQAYKMVAAEGWLFGPLIVKDSGPLRGCSPLSMDITPR